MMTHMCYSKLDFGRNPNKFRKKSFDTDDQKTVTTRMMTHVLVKVREEAGRWRSFHSNKKSLAVTACPPNPEIRSEDLRN